MNDTGGALATTLNRLFDTRPGISNYAIARQVQAQLGVSITSQYIGQLRSGQKRNPTIQHVRALADAFGVPARYLVDHDGGDADMEAHVLVARVIRRNELREVVTALAGLSDNALASIAPIVEQARRLEGPAATLGETVVSGT